jgi:hypothetical protein
VGVVGGALSVTGGGVVAGRRSQPASEAIAAATVTATNTPRVLTDDFIVISWVE